MWVGSERQRKRGMKTNGILIHESDHVVTLTLPVEAGEAVTYIRKGILTQVEAIEDIPQYHKIAVQDIGKGRKIRKYGEEIGEAVSHISAGGWVHVHNLQSSCLADTRQEREETI